MAFWSTRLAVGSWLTDAIGLKATGSPTLQLLIIPGNPGLSSFYKVNPDDALLCPMLQQLHTCQQQFLCLVPQGLSHISLQASATLDLNS